MFDCLMLCIGGRIGSKGRIEDNVRDEEGIPLVSNYDESIGFNSTWSLDHLWLSVRGAYMSGTRLIGYSQFHFMLCDYSPSSKQQKDIHHQGHTRNKALQMRTRPIGKRQLSSMLGATE